MLSTLACGLHIPEIFTSVKFIEFIKTIEKNINSEPAGVVPATLNPGLVQRLEYRSSDFSWAAGCFPTFGGYSKSNHFR